MKIKVGQEKLAKALNSVSRVAAGTRSSLPILSNVLMRVDDKKVTLTTTNLDMAVVCYLPTLESENGVVTVPARLMAEFVTNLPKTETIEITAEGAKVVVEAGGYSSQINGALADEFPELPEIDEAKATIFTVGAEEFKLGLTQVMIATSNDMTRPALTGIYFNTHENALYLAATDGYRLAERKIAEKVGAEIATIVPAASLRSVAGLLSDEVKEIGILFDEAQVRFRIGEVEVTSKLLSGSFPDYRQLIPKESEVNIELERGELTRTTKLAALFAKEVGGSVVCETSVESETFTIAAVANELGENASKIKTAVDADGKVTLNSRFLLDALNVLEGGEVGFRFSNKLDPVVLKSKKDENYTHIIMPLKS